MEPCIFINNANEILKHHNFETPAQSWDLKPVNAEVQTHTFTPETAGSLVTELMAAGTKQ